MTKLWTALFVLTALAACSKSKPANTTTTGTGSETTASADIPDPTLPSWAPPSCKQYHATVVKLSGCMAVAQEERDAMTARYDADTKSWHDLTNAQQSDLDRVGAECSAKDAEVKTKLAPCEGGDAAAMR
jgi:hypothetical protein